MARRLCGKELVGFSLRFSVRLLDLVALAGKSRLPSTTANMASSSCRRIRELPPPGSSAAADPSWPVNQEILRKKALKEEGKKAIAGVGDARLRYTHPFPAGEPVTVRCGGSRWANREVRKAIADRAHRC